MREDFSALLDIYGINEKKQEDYDQIFEINSIIKKNNSFSKYTYDVICSSTIHFLRKTFVKLKLIDNFHNFSKYVHWREIRVRTR